MKRPEKQEARDLEEPLKRPPRKKEKKKPEKKEEPQPDLFNILLDQNNKNPFEGINNSSTEIIFPLIDKDLINDSNPIFDNGLPFKSPNESIDLAELLQEKSTKSEGFSSFQPDLSSDDGLRFGSTDEVKINSKLKNFDRPIEYASGVTVPPQPISENENKSSFLGSLLSSMGKAAVIGTLVIGSTIGMAKCTMDSIEKQKDPVAYSIKKEYDEKFEKLSDEYDSIVRFGVWGKEKDELYNLQIETIRLRGEFKKNGLEYEKVVELEDKIKESIPKVKSVEQKSSASNLEIITDSVKESVSGVVASAQSILSPKKSTTSSSSVPSRISFEGSKFKVYNNSGKKLFTKDIEYYGARNDPYDRANTFHINDAKIGDVDGDGDKEIVVIGSHNVLYPGQVTVWSDEGDFEGRYWNPGRLNKVMLQDLNGDNAKDIVVSGCSNDIHGSHNVVPVLFALNGKLRPSGEAPPNYGSHNLGRKMWYIHWNKKDYKITRLESKNNKIYTYENNGNLFSCIDFNGNNTSCN